MSESIFIVAYLQNFVKLHLVVAFDPSKRLSIRIGGFMVLRPKDFDVRWSFLFFRALQFVLRLVPFNIPISLSPLSWVCFGRLLILVLFL